MDKNELRLEDLTENHRYIADIIGIDALIKVCENMGGTAITIPTDKGLHKNYIRRRVLENKNLLSPKQIAKKCGCCESTVYNIFKSPCIYVPRDAPEEFYIGDLNQELQIVAEIIGFDQCLKLCHIYESQLLYIPTIKELMKKLIERKVIEESDLFSKSELARMYGISLSMVYNILKGQKKDVERPME